jgi:hypothetical protein
LRFKQVGDSRMSHGKKVEPRIYHRKGLFAEGNKGGFLKRGTPS